MYVFIDAKTYNLDVFQRLKRTNRYVFLAKNVKIFTYLYIIKIFHINAFLSISDLDSLTYPQT